MQRIRNSKNVFFISEFVELRRGLQNGGNDES